MAKRWLVGLVAAVAVVGLAGVGFSAFTATATVNGYATAGSVSLQITETGGYACFYLPDTPYGYASAPGNVSFSPIRDGGTEVSLNVSNLTPGVICSGLILLTNAGSVPLNVSVSLYTAGFNGVCGAYDYDCYDAITYSGIQASGHYWFGGSPTAGGPSDLSANFVTLAPGGSFVDDIGILIETGSTSAPGAAAFSLVYTGSAGF
ncbi:MAG TPA: hypothetical protein VML53_05030 [Thermoplasmata archaeon]|nr:hypothetical protein [Thermoplasmata archaeon]